MPAKDVYHETVRNALIADGWTITHDPFTLEMDAGENLYVDLGAERLLAAEKGIEKIAVEIKSFISFSPFSDFHNALGQYLSYKWLLEETDPERKLYLAVPAEKQKWFEQKLLPRKAVLKLPLRLIYFDDETETITTWTN